MKRLLSFVLVLTMLATMFVGVTAVQADATATIALVGATVDSNGQFDVKITLQNDADLLSAQIGIKYDTTKLTALNLTPSAYVTESNIANGEIKVMFDAAEATSFATATDFATVKFQVADGVDYSTVEFSIDGGFTEIATAPEYAIADYNFDTTGFVLADEVCLHESTREEVVSNATCTEAGSKNVICNKCDEVVDTVEIPKLNHTESDWIVDREPTEVSTGSQHKECTVCGEVLETEDIPMLEEEGVLQQGEAGKNVVWKLYEDGTLKLIGTGDAVVMDNYTASKKSPYLKYAKQISKVEVIGVPKLGSRAFYSLAYAKEIVVDEATTELGSWAMFSCLYLKDITFKGNLEVIGAGNFNKVPSLKFFRVPNMSKDEYKAIALGASNKTYYGKYTVVAEDQIFGVTGTLDWTLKDSILTFGGYGNMDDTYTTSNGNNPAPWYDWNKEIVSIEFSSGITLIGQYGFYGFKALKHVKLPATLKTIKKYAFFGCSNIESVTMYNNVELLDGSVFSKSPTATPTFNYLGTKEELKAIAGYSSDDFKKYTTVTRSAVAQGTTGECSWLIDQFGILVVSGNGAMADYADAASTPWAEYAEQINEVNVKTGVTYIGDYAFANLANVSSVLVENTVNYIGNYAFANDAAIKTVDIGNRVFEVRENAFAGCEGIKNVNYIGSREGFDAIAIYKGNSKFKSAKLNVIAPSADGIIASGIVKQTVSGEGENEVRYTNTFTLYNDGLMVLSGPLAYDADKNGAAPWLPYADQIKTIVVEKTQAATTLKQKVFANLPNVESIYLSSAITSLAESNTFYDLGSLRTVYFGGVTSINNYALNSGTAGITKVIYNGTDKNEITITGTASTTITKRLENATWVYCK